MEMTQSKPMAGVGSEGRISGKGPGVTLRPQNGHPVTNRSVDEKGDAGVKLAAKRAKTVIRKDASYTDGAIAVAKRIRGGI
jgi:hypothetical protein